MTKFAIKMELSPKRITHLITNAIESGAINYWANEAIPSKKAQELEEKYWYTEERVLTGVENKRAMFYLKYDLPDLDEGNGKGKKAITPAAITRGLKSMMINSPHAFAAWLAEEDDSTTADVFMQHVVFGEVIYG